LPKKKSSPNKPQVLMARYLAVRTNQITIEDLAPERDGAAARLIRKEGVGRSLKAGERVEPGADTLLLVERGKIRIYPPGAAESDLEATALPGSVLGEMPLLAPGRFGAVLEASEDSEVLMLERKLIRKIIARCPATALALIEKLGTLLVRAEDLLLAQRGIVRPALVTLLVGLADENDVISGVTQQDLADTLLVHRATIWKCMKELRKEGLLDWSRSRIEIHDPERLRRLQWASEAA
jgi:CRP-like cAMP-binding protein